MAKHPENKGERPAPDSRKPADSKTEEEDSAAPSKTDLIRIKLKLVANYAIRYFAPGVAVLALIISIIAVTGNKSADARFSDTLTKTEDMNASLSASKIELEKLKATLAQEKSLQEEDRIKQDERLAKIIQSITQLQVKMKISPTLEEQLHQPASAPVAAPAAASAPLAAPAAASAVAPAKAAAAKPVEKKLSPQVQGMKEAIEKFNKQ